MLPLNQVPAKAILFRTTTASSATVCRRHPRNWDRRRKDYAHKPTAAVRKKLQQWASQMNCTGALQQKEAVTQTRPSPETNCRISQSERAPALKNQRGSVDDS
jgi:hypothetical protein